MGIKNTEKVQDLSPLSHSACRPTNRKVKILTKRITRFLLSFINEVNDFQMFSSSIEIENLQDIHKVRNNWKN